jgi:hypothetical protein
LVSLEPPFKFHSKFYLKICEVARGYVVAWDNENAKSLMNGGFSDNGGKIRKGWKRKSRSRRNIDSVRRSPS